MVNARWDNWLVIREAADEFSDPEDNFKFDRSEDGISNDHDKIKDDLFHAVWDKHEQDARQFFDSISNRDPEVRELLKQLDSAKHPSEFEEPKHPSDVDEFEPPIADKGDGGDEDFGGE